MTRFLIINVLSVFLFTALPAHGLQQDATNGKMMKMCMKMMENDMSDRCMSMCMNMMDMEGMDMEKDQDEVQDYRDQTPDEFKEELTGLVDIYLDVKNALIESDPNRVAETAGQAKDQLESIKHDLKGEAMQKWMNVHQKLMVSLESMAETDDLDQISSEFRSLSKLFVETVQSFGVEGVVYHQYCPMEEASWLSSEEQIKNPYMAETMPGCGEVIERLE